jgi:hypothetical protein
MEVKEQICRFAVDVDLSREDQKVTKELYTIDEMKESILRINKVLLKHVHGLREEDLSVVYQKKDPYLKGTTLKHGYKFLYLRFALDLKMQTHLLQILKDKIRGLDHTCYKNPWLIPGSRKDKISGVYRQECVYTQKNGKLIRHDLIDWTKENIKWHQFDKTKGIEFHLPRILSNNALKFVQSTTMDWLGEIVEDHEEIQVCKIFDQTPPEEKKQEVERKDDIEWEDQPVDILEDWLTTTEGGENFHILDDYDEKNQLIIKRMVKGKSVECFVTEGKEHENTDFSSFINGGDICIYCFRCSKTKRIYTDNGEEGKKKRNMNQRN